ncbi:hypothetical protein GLOIN_2v1581814 [Rhizophagus irregularis DAOM 181602=DAOM 197198]|nr:hypothetical protein GLOIN_2v1581814 [Rhizophagus irregularis DAOM 181602=DAOM 197198]
MNESYTNNAILTFYKITSFPYFPYFPLTDCLFYKYLVFFFQTAFIIIIIILSLSLSSLWNIGFCLFYNYPFFNDIVDLYFATTKK